MDVTDVGSRSETWLAGSPRRGRCGPSPSGRHLAHDGRLGPGPLRRSGRDGPPRARPSPPRHPRNGHGLLCLDGLAAVGGVSSAQGMSAIDRPLDEDFLEGLRSAIGRPSRIPGWPTPGPSSACSDWCSTRGEALGSAGRTHLLGLAGHDRHAPGSPGVRPAAGDGHVARGDPARPGGRVRRGGGRCGLSALRRRELRDRLRRPRRRRGLRLRRHVLAATSSAATSSAATSSATPPTEP